MGGSGDAFQRKSVTRSTVGIGAPVQNFDTRWHRGGRDRHSSAFRNDLLSNEELYNSIESNRSGSGKSSTSSSSFESQPTKSTAAATSVKNHQDFSVANNARRSNGQNKYLQ